MSQASTGSPVGAHQVVTLMGLHDRGASSTDEEHPGTTAIPLVEERVVVSKNETTTGRVRVRTVVASTETLVRQDLASEEVSVTRVAVGRIVDEPPSIRTEGDVTIIPVLEEVVIVETKLLLKEEVHIRRTRTTQEVEQAVTLRKQQAIIEEFRDDGRPLER